MKQTPAILSPCSNLASAAIRILLRSSSFRWSVALSAGLVPLTLTLGGPFVLQGERPTLATATGLYTFALIWALLPGPWPTLQAHSKRGLLGELGSDLGLSTGWLAAAILGITTVSVIGVMSALLFSNNPAHSAWIQVLASQAVAAVVFTALCCATAGVGCTLSGPTTGRFLLLMWIISAPTLADALRTTHAPQLAVDVLLLLTNSSPLEASRTIPWGHRLAALGLAGCLGLVSKAAHQCWEEKGRKLTDR